MSVLQSTNLVFLTLVDCCGSRDLAPDAKGEGSKRQKRATAASTIEIKTNSEDNANTTQPLRAGSRDAEYARAGKGQKHSEQNKKLNRGVDEVIGRFLKPEKNYKRKQPNVWCHS